MRDWNLWAVERDIGFTFSTLLASECVCYQRTIWQQSLVFTAIIFYQSLQSSFKEITHIYKYLISKCKAERCAMLHTVQEILSNSTIKTITH